MPTQDYWGSPDMSQTASVNPSAASSTTSWASPAASASPASTDPNQQPLTWQQDPNIPMNQGNNWSDAFPQYNPYGQGQPTPSPTPDSQQLASQLPVNQAQYNPNDGGTRGWIMDPSNPNQAAWEYWTGSQNTDPWMRNSITGQMYNGGWNISDPNSFANMQQWVSGMWAAGKNPWNDPTFNNVMMSFLAKGNPTIQGDAFTNMVNSLRGTPNAQVRVEPNSWYGNFAFVKPGTSMQA